MTSPQWITAPTLVSYPQAVAEMEAVVEGILAGEQSERIWLVEHPPLYTAGSSADRDELKDAARFPVFETGRGGRYTYHGPGQRVIYAMLDLRQRGKDVRAHVWRLEEWVIRVLADFGIKGERREGRVGIWVVREVDCLGQDGLIPLPLREGLGVGLSTPEQNSEGLSCSNNPTPNPSRKGRGTASGLLIDQPPSVVVIEEKIAAIGVRVRKWVAYHGLALNVAPDLTHFSGIVPCGIADYGVTSLRQLGVDVTMAQVDAAFWRHVGVVLGD